MEKHFRTLSLPPTATRDEVVAAWKKKAQATHPDRNGGDATAYIEASNAYNALLRHFEAEDNKDIFEDIFKMIATKKREVTR